MSMRISAAAAATAAAARKENGEARNKNWFLCDNKTNKILVFTIDFVCRL